MSREMQILIGKLDSWEMEIIAADYMTPEDHIRVRMIHGFRNKIDEAININGKHVSVDAPFTDSDENTLLDVLINNDAPAADKQLFIESLRQEINKALEGLNERERNIIEAFFGINQPEMTLDEIGTKYHLTRERVRQIKEKAIRRLRTTTNNKLLKSYLGQ